MCLDCWSPLSSRWKSDLAFALSSLLSSSLMKIIVTKIAFAVMSDLFEAIVGLEICVSNFEVLKLVDEDPVEADDEEESSFAEWFSSFDFVADLAFAAMSDLFDAIIAFKVCVLTIDDLFLVDEDPVEADDEE